MHMSEDIHARYDLVGLVMPNLPVGIEAFHFLTNNHIFFVLEKEEDGFLGRSTGKKGKYPVTRLTRLIARF